MGKLKKNLPDKNGQDMGHEGERFSHKPFFLSGTNDRAVLLVHGWTANPYEVYPLGKYLHDRGYTVYAPLLSGHGTKPHDLMNVRWEDWRNDVDRAYQKLKKGEYAKIYVAGTSMGAGLSAILAVDNPEISGLVLMATPYAIRLEKPTLIYAKFLSLFKKYHRKHYPPSLKRRATVTRKISYQMYPIKSVLEVIRMVRFFRQQISNVQQPCLMIQSIADHVVDKKSLENIFKHIGSQKKTKKYLAEAYHTFVSDVKNEDIFKDILDFFEEN